MHYIKNNIFTANEYADSIEPLFFIGRLSAVVPFSIIRNSKNISLKLSVPSVVFLFLTCVVLTGSVIYVIISGETIAGKIFDSPFLKICNQIRILSTYFSVMILFINTIFKKHFYETIITSMISIENMFKVLGILKNYSKIRMIHLILSIVLGFVHLSYVAVTVGISLTWEKAPTFAMIAVLHIPSNAITGTLIMFSSVANILQMNLHILNQELSLLCEKPSFVKSGRPLYAFNDCKVKNIVAWHTNEKTRTENLSEKLRIIIKIYDKVCYCTDIINQCFSWNMLCVLGISFTSFIFNVFYSLSTTILMWNGQPAWGHVSFLLFSLHQSIIYVLIILIAVLSCYKCDSQAKKIKILMGKIMIQETDEDILRKLHQILTYMVNRTPKFTVCQLFTIDNTVLFSMLGSASTYLIILMQLSMDSKFMTN